MSKQLPSTHPPLSVFTLDGPRIDLGDGTLSAGTQSACSLVEVAAQSTWHQCGKANSAWKPKKKGSPTSAPASFVQAELSNKVIYPMPHHDRSGTGRLWVVGEARQVITNRCCPSTVVLLLLLGTIWIDNALQVESPRVAHLITHVMFFYDLTFGPLVSSWRLIGVTGVSGWGGLVGNKNNNTRYYQ